MTDNSISNSHWTNVGNGLPGTIQMTRNMKPLKDTNEMVNWSFITVISIEVAHIFIISDYSKNNRVNG